MIRKILLFILIWSFLVSITGQNNNLNFKHFNIIDGLSNSEIKCIAQDSSGILWLGTKDGLNSFDGYRFRSYRHENQNLKSLKGNVIFSLLIDSENNLYVGTDEGLHIYKRESDSFLRINISKSTKRSNVIVSLLEDSKHRIWIGTRDGLYMIDKNEKIYEFHHQDNDKNSIGSDLIFTIAEDYNNRIWIGNSSTLSVFNEKNFSFENHRVGQIALKNPKDNNDITAIFDNGNGELWIGTQYHGLFLYNTSNKTYKKFSKYPHDLKGVSDNFISQIYKTSSRGLWICTFRNGINILNSDNSGFNHLFYDELNPEGLISNYIFAIYEDLQGNIWIGTGEGLDVIYNNKKKFIHIKRELRRDYKSINNNNILSIIQDRKDNLWIGTKGGGLNYFDNKQKKFKYYKHDPSNPSSIIGNDVSKVLEDSEGRIWLGCASGLSLVIDIQKGIFKNYYHEPGDTNSLSNSWILDLLEDSKDKILIGTGGGLNILDITNQKFTRFKHDEAPLGTFWVPCVFKDKSGVIWIGSANGLRKLNSDNQTFTEYIPITNDSSILSNSMVQAIYEDSKGNLWLGTERGLNKFDREKEIFTSFTIKDGLPNDVIGGILEDKNGFLWISTNKGISKFDQVKKTFRNYDINDGLQSNQFYGAYYKNANGKMFFGGVNGYNSFFPDSILDNTSIPPVIITNFSVKSGNPKTIEYFKSKSNFSDSEEIILSYNESFFNIEFVALNFIHAEKNRYSYKLENFDNKWIDSGNERIANYTNVPPGEYIFRVKASNNDNYWNNKGISLKIIITPPLWKTWWAYLIYACIFIIFMINFRKYSIIKANLKNQLILEHIEREKINEINQLKMRFFTHVSHDFRTPLILILGPLGKLINSIDFEDKIKKQFLLMYKNAEILLRLVNELLDFRKIESGHIKLKASKTDLNDFINSISQVFTEFAQLKNIEFEISIPNDNIEAYIDHDKIERVVYNLLSNSFKFTPEHGKISLSLRKIQNPAKGKGFDKFNQGYAEIEIKDSGKGFSKEQFERIFERFYQVETNDGFNPTGSGIGLSIVKSFIELHKGEITVDSKIDKGSSFQIRLPLGIKHLKDSEIIEVDEKGKKTFELTAYSTLSKKHLVPDEIVKTEGNKKEKKKLLLLIEDNEDVRSYIKSAMIEKYRIEEASDGITGLEMANKFFPDLIISDVMMPGMDGVELCRRLKSEIKTSHIPLILLTAKTSEEYEITGLETGADDYITKPFSMDILLLRIRNILASRNQIIKKFNKEFSIDENEPSISLIDKQFLKKAALVVAKNIANVDFSVKQFADEMAMSRYNMFRKLKSLTNHAPNDFIKSIRLKKAHELLKSQKYDVKQIIEMVGFVNMNHFRSCFYQEFGVKPEFSHQIKMKDEEMD